MVDFMHQSVVKTVWEADRLRNVFGRRNVFEILDDGDAMAFGPCPDRTLVACAIMNQHGIRPTVVYHERRVPGFIPSTAHIAMEITVDGQDYMMDFGSRETRLVEGTYYFNKEVEETIALKRFDLFDMGIDVMTMTPHQIFSVVATEHIHLDEKFDYYEKQAKKYSVRILEDRLALDREHSVYNEL
ncbi:hypothetical protein ABZW18_18410 [Streptomyces sp. NPDC004647]|uniref:hypothetical protein n=1 Tax=Streptomyces sp. NPDC004647 TaxID=3154671 RepID=UPI0033B51CF5